MSTLTRLRGGLPGPLDLPMWSWLQFPGPGIRIEETLDGDRYTVRAELPGVDPADIEVTLAGEVLKIQVERNETHAGRAHSEFHYGTFHRAVPVPPGLRADTVTAGYRSGILEITALVAEPEQTGKTIPVSVTPPEA